MSSTEAENLRGRGTADLCKRCWLNADWESSHPGQAPRKLDPIRHRRESQDTGTRRKEVASVVICMETDEVAIKDSKENFAADGKDPDNFVLASVSFPDVAIRG
jgi:hypothetical protein